MGTDPTMAEPTAPTDRANRHALLIVFLVVVIDLLGFGIVLPLLPRFAKGYVDTVYPGRADTWVGPHSGAIYRRPSMLQSSY